MARRISRRSSIRRAAALAAAPLAAGCSASHFGFPRPASVTRANASAGGRPNVIVILLDDLGSIDARCYGAADLATPNLDALAESGVRFTQCYGNAPICSPSRASILTGRYPQRAGLTTNGASQPGGPALPLSQVTLAQVMKSAGYVTGHVGKWHLGYTPQTMPNARGFDSSFGHMSGCIDNYSHFYYWSGPNRHDLWHDGAEIWREGEYFGDIMVDQCGRFLDAHRDRPFFLYWAINQPHYPLQARRRWRDHYKGLPPPRSMYAASVSTLDELIGQVLKKLADLGLARRTIVVLQSDHGHSTEDRTFGGGGNAGPYRGAKFSLFEGGIRVVAMLRWPGTLPRGAVRDQLVAGCDWLPTLCELTGVPLPDRRLDGRSIVPVLHSSDAASPHPVFHWQFDRQWAVREGNWKLIGNPVDSSNKAPVTADDTLFLGNLGQDVTEMKNLAREFGDVVTRLSGLHSEWTLEVRETQDAQSQPGH